MPYTIMFLCMFEVFFNKTHTQKKKQFIFIDSAYCLDWHLFIVSLCEGLLSPLHEVHRDIYIYPHFIDKAL